MDVEKVRELAELMEKHGLTEIRLRDGETLISLRKGSPGETMVLPAAPQMSHAFAGHLPAPAPASASPPTAPSAAQDEGLVPIRSPMVGTYYASPDPESPAFVQVGSSVDQNTPVCIIEAMKVFNEIKAEVAGTIERILVSNEQPVEYGQPLMMVRPR
jgi:acetyl-CoA carboxylase biotin carboxyl carrier protein